MRGALARGGMLRRVEDEGQVRRCSCLFVTEQPVRVDVPAANLGLRTIDGYGIVALHRQRRPVAGANSFLCVLLLSETWIDSDEGPIRESKSAAESTSSISSGGLGLCGYCRQGSWDCVRFARH